MRARAMRFLGVTVVTAGLGQVLIFAFFAGLGWPAVVANAVAVIVVMLVGFALSIQYVWADAAASDRRTQILAFIVMGLVGLLISTASVRLVTARIDHVLAANIGSFLGYGIAWVLRFFVLDRYIFQGTDLTNEHVLKEESTEKNHRRPDADISGRREGPDSESERQKASVWWAIGGAAALMLAMRGYTAWTADLRYDENLTGWVTSGSFSETINRSWTHQGQSPLYFACLWIWEQVFGSSEVSMRSPSVIMFALSIWQIAALGRDVNHVRAGQTAAVLFMAMPVLGFEARPYAAMGLVLILSARAGLRWIDGGPEVVGGVWATTAALALYFSPFSLYALIPHVAIAVVAVRRGRARALLGWLILGFVLVAPLIPQVLALRGRQDTLVFAETPSLLDLVAALAPMAVLFALFIAWVSSLSESDGATARQMSRLLPEPLHRWFVGLWLVGPAVGLFLQSHLTGSSVFVDRYQISAAPAVALCAGLLFSALPRMQGVYGAAVAFGVLLLVSSVHHSPQWYEATEVINRTDRDAEVWTNTGYIESGDPSYFQGEHNDYLNAPLLWHGADRTLVAVPTVFTSETAPVHDANLARLTAAQSPVLLVLTSLENSGSIYIEESLQSAGYEEVESSYTWPVNLVLYEPSGP